MGYRKLFAILLMGITISAFPAAVWGEPTVSQDNAEINAFDAGQADSVWNVSEISGNYVLAYYYKDSGRLEVIAPGGDALMNSLSDNLIARLSGNEAEKPREKDIQSVKIGKGITTSNLSKLFSNFENMRSVTFEDAEFFTKYSQNMSEMFSGCRSLTELDVSRFDTSNAEYMYSMFDGCESLTKLDVSGFNTSKVTDMAWMFDGCKSLETLDVSRFDTSNTVDMQAMFNDCTLLKNLDVSRFKTSNVINMRAMFGECVSLPRLDVSGFDTSSVMDMSEMFSDCSNISGLDVRKFNTENVYDLKNMFNGCKALEVLDVGNFRTPRLGLTTEFIVNSGTQGMFADCRKLTDLDLSGFNTVRVSNMDWMFYDCGALEELDLSSFNTESLQSMESMFSGCVKLKKLELGSFKTPLVVNMNNAFSNCIMLKNIDLSGFDLSNINGPFSLWTCKSLETIKTPLKVNESYIVELPCKFYDEAGKPYVNLGSDIPLNSLLTKERPSLINSPNIVKNRGKVLFGLLV